MLASPPRAPARLAPRAWRVPDGVPEGAFRAILEARMEARLADLRAENERARAVAEVRAEAERKLALEVGAEALEKWRRYVAAERRQKRLDRSRLSGADDYVEKDRELRARARATAVAMQKQLGIDRSRVAAVHGRANGRLRELGRIERESGPGVAMMMRDEPDWTLTPAWLQFIPPYATQDDYDEGWNSGFSIVTSPHVNALVGQVGERVSLTNGDASDFDAAAVSRYSTNAVIFITPGTGPLEVWVEAQALETLHHADFVDEWGYSSASVAQNNYITMQTFTGGASVRREVETSSFRITDRTDGKWTDRFIAPGETRWFQFFSDRAFQAGEIIWMDVGSCSYNFGLTNDVEVRSTIDFRWFLRQVLVRPTGL